MHHFPTVERIVIIQVIFLEVILLLVLDVVLRTTILKQGPIDIETTRSTAAGTTYSLGRIEIEQAFIVLGSNEFVLAIVKGILNLHGARYGVESEEGKGSDFWFEMETVRKPAAEESEKKDG